VTPIQHWIQTSRLLLNPRLQRRKGIIMGLKYQIAKLEDVAEAVRHMYVARDGQYFLDVDGVVPKERVDEFRNNNIELQKQIDRYKGIDPTKHAELLAIQQEVEEGKLIKEGKVEEVVQLRVKTMKATLESQVNEFGQKLAVANRQLETLLVDNVVKTAAIKNGVVPSAVEDVVLRAKTVYSVVDGVPTPKGPDGQVVFGNDGKTPMPVDEWIVSLRSTAGHLFQGSTGSGAGGGGITGVKDMSKLSPVDKIAAGLAMRGKGMMTDLPQAS
jgi:hypothetical protein